ncbi:hypothetical protein [Subtercola endophyticus]|uniref:hypothetical protein n=1 Tax=Subtercola endophyticus TaxID=2895559 RepID=UPI001E2CD3E2|nr:hypothetical protein [Subtercola endophyticus]UFS58087.1 hypothetical protein LQ955_13825 [Subtercola endophyticus]
MTAHRAASASSAVAQPAEDRRAVPAPVTLIAAAGFGALLGGPLLAAVRTSRRRIRR